jgi:hypothetical protein
MRFIVMAVSLALLATQAHANDCEAKAALVVSTLGATIEGRSSLSISLHHGAVPDGFTIGCDSISSPADGPDLGMGWDTKDPSGSFWSLAASAGAIITDASPKAIEAGARACYDAARKTSNGIAELVAMKSDSNAHCCGKAKARSSSASSGGMPPSKKRSNGSLRIPRRN